MKYSVKKTSTTGTWPHEKNERKNMGLPILREAGWLIITLTIYHCYDLSFSDFEEKDLDYQVVKNANNISHLFYMDNQK